MTSMEEARANGNEIITKHKASVDQIFADHKEVIVRQAELSIKSEKSNAKQQLNKAIATYQTELKREQETMQNQLKKKLFETIRLRLNTYMQTEAYIDQLESYINSAKEFAAGASISIYINASDKDKAKELESRTNTVLTVYKDDFIGGIRSVLHERNILIDHSFSSALVEQYDNFRFSGGGLDD